MGILGAAPAYIIMKRQPLGRVGAFVLVRTSGPMVRLSSLTLLWQKSVSGAIAHGVGRC